MINAAVIGVGSMGRNHARIYHELKNVNLVAVCDSNKKSAKEIARQYNTEHYFDHRELVKNENLDAVSIAVPTQQHKTIALDFINRGISVLVEKPLASNSKDAKQLTRKAKEKRVTLAVGHIERFNPAVIKLNDLIKKDEFGDILSIVVRRVGIFPPRVKDVNVVIDLAVHDLDIVTSILGNRQDRYVQKGAAHFLKRKKIVQTYFLITVILDVLFRLIG